MLIERRWKKWLYFYIPLTLFVIGTLFPFYWLVITAIRPDSELYRFGSAVLQYDCYTGHAVRPPEEFRDQPEEWREVTEEPRRYGFHATLKAPFYLAPSCSEAQLVSAFLSFAAIGRTVATIQPVVTMLSGFAAIVPDHASPASSLMGTPPSPETAAREAGFGAVGGLAVPTWVGTRRTLSQGEVAS